MRRFHTAGPVRPDKHYWIAPLDRVNLAQILRLVRSRRYLVMHAQRQTGKTSALLALRDLLNGGSVGEYRCAYVNVEPAKAAGEDVGRGMRAIALQLAAEEGRLIVFDMRDGRSWADRVWREEREWEGTKIVAWGA